MWRLRVCYCIPSTITGSIFWSGKHVWVCIFIHRWTCSTITMYVFIHKMFSEISSYMLNEMTYTKHFKICHVFRIQKPTIYLSNIKLWFLKSINICESHNVTYIYYSRKRGMEQNGSVRVTETMWLESISSTHILVVPN